MGLHWHYGETYFVTEIQAQEPSSADLVEANCAEQLAAQTKIAASAEGLHPGVSTIGWPPALLVHLADTMVASALIPLLTPPEPHRTQLRLRAGQDH